MSTSPDLSSSTLNAGDTILWEGQQMKIASFYKNATHVFEHDPTHTPQATCIVTYETASGFCGFVCEYETKFDRIPDLSSMQRLRDEV